MKSPRLLLCALFAGVNWLFNALSINPGLPLIRGTGLASSLEVTEAGRGATYRRDGAGSDALPGGLSSDYRLRSGMKTENGTIVRYFSAERRQTGAGD